MSVIYFKFWGCKLFLAPINFVARYLSELLPCTGFEMIYWDAYYSIMFWSDCLVLGGKSLYHVFIISKKLKVKIGHAILHPMPWAGRCGTNKAMRIFMLYIFQEEADNYQGINPLWESSGEANSNKLGKVISSFFYFNFKDHTALW